MHSSSRIGLLVCALATLVVGAGSPRPVGAVEKSITLFNGHDLKGFYTFLPSKGKIILQSEGAEIFYRKVELHPLRK
jgi:hypothetical protein